MLKKQQVKNALPVDAVVVLPSAQAITDNVTSSGAVSALLLVTFTTISVTFSVGNSLLGNDSGAPLIGTVSRPDSVVKVTVISTTLFEVSTISRTTAPPFGNLISKMGFVSVKSTPFVIRSCLLGISVGFV